MSISFKNQNFYFKAILFLAFSHLITANPVQAFGVTFSTESGSGFNSTDNGGFENSFTNWNTNGDTTVQNGAFQGINQLEGSNHALITNSCSTNITSPGFCTSTTGGSRIDDTDGMGNAIDFNQSGNDQIDASVENPQLQTFFGLDANDFSIARENNTLPDTEGRSPKEGSGIQQYVQIEITQADVDNGFNSFNLNFNYAYLTNDGRNTVPGLGDQDFAFLSFYDVSGDDSLTVLRDSDVNPFPTRTDPNTDYLEQDTSNYSAGNQFTQTVSGLPAGTYTYSLGFGVVDVDGSGYTSALLLDNLSITQNVPFEFSPGMGLALMFILISADRIRVTRKSKSLKNETLQ